MVDFTNPGVAIEIVRNLYYGQKRANQLVQETMKATSVSEPTVYSVLTELQKNGIITKDIKSKRNVVYTLTKEGKNLLLKEHFQAIDAMLTNVKDPSRRREILIELLMEDMLEELPGEWYSDEARREALRKSVGDEIDSVKKRMHRMTDLIQ